MKITLPDHQAVVIGGASGIGRAIALSFLESGAKVTVLDRDDEALGILSRDFPAIEGHSVDISDFESLEAFASDREIDHLVVSAAIGSGKEAMPFWKMHPSDWDRVIDVSLMGTVRSLHAFVPGLRDGQPERKSVLLLSSVAGQIGSPTDPPYSAAKAAVINFAQVAARDFAPHGIRVNTIAPGMVQTDLNRSVFEATAAHTGVSYGEWAKEKIERISPLGRWQETCEIGAMSVFLASEYGRNITGQTINVDGGQVMHS